MAFVDLGDGRSTDIRRATDLVRSSEQAGFERVMVLLAAQAARRRLGDAGETMPLHVAISAPLLEHFGVGFDHVEAEPPQQV